MLLIPPLHLVFTKVLIPFFHMVLYIVSTLSEILVMTTNVTVHWSSDRKFIPKSNYLTSERQLVFYLLYITLNMNHSQAPNVGSAMRGAHLL